MSRASGNVEHRRRSEKRSLDASLPTIAASSSTITKRAFGIFDLKEVDIGFAVIWSKIASFSSAGVTALTSVVLREFPCRSDLGPRDHAGFGGRIMRGVLGLPSFARDRGDVLMIRRTFLLYIAGTTALQHMKRTRRD